MSGTFDPGSDWGMADWARKAVAWGNVPPRLPANSVRLVTVHQGHCDLPGCEWAGGCLPDEKAANDQCDQHLERHRAALAWARGAGGERQRQGSHGLR